MVALSNTPQHGVGEASAIQRATVPANDDLVLDVLWLRPEVIASLRAVLYSSDICIIGISERNVEVGGILITMGHL